MKFVELAFSPFSKMNEIKRYSSVHQETEETVSDHITEVSSMCYLIAKEMINNYNESLDIGILLERCLLHDLDEVVTGDIPRNTKYASEDAHFQLNLVSESIINKLEKSLGVPILDPWKNAKSGKEGLILKVADLLVVVRKTMTEIDLRSNLAFLKVSIELQDHLSEICKNFTKKSKNLGFNGKSIDFLWSLLYDSKFEIERINNNYSYIINKYKFDANIL